MIAARTNGRPINIGDLLLNHLQNEGVSPTSRAEVGPLFIQRHGPEAIAELMRACLTGDVRVIFDGVRLSLTCRAIVAQLPKSQVWVVRATPENCRRRLSNRLRDTGVDATEIDRLLERASTYDREQIDIECMANAFLANDGSVECLAHQVDDAIRTHLASHS